MQTIFWFCNRSLCALVVSKTEGVSFSDFYFINPTVGIAAASDIDSSRTIWRTEDGGLNWTNVFSQRNYFINAIWFTTDQVGWAVGYFEDVGRGKKPIINQSTDGGLTWKNIYTNLSAGGDRSGEPLLDIQFKNEHEGLALSNYSESAITVDGGLTWNLTYDGDGKELIPAYGLYKCIGGQSKMYIAGRQGTVTQWK